MTECLSSVPPPPPPTIDDTHMRMPPITMPDVVVARDGESAAKLILFAGAERVFDDAIAVRLDGQFDPSDRAARLVALVDDLIPESLPGLRVRSLISLSEEDAIAQLGAAAVGSELDRSDAAGLRARMEHPPLKVRLSERDLLELHRAKPASDAQIEHYVMAKVYWAWRYGLTNIVFQPFDALRLSTTLEEIDRVAMILDGEYVRVINQLVGPRLYQPLSRLLRDGPNRLPAPQSVDAAATIQPLQEPRLYSLIVTGEAGAWSRPRNGMSRDRFGEHTVETLVSQFKKLDQTSLDRLQRLPAILAYEKVRDLPAHVARLRKVTLGADSEIRFEHEPVPGIAPISPDRLAELAWELDIGRYEMNRTHWAIKDVDLDRVLAEEGLSTGTHGILQPQSSGVSAQPRTLSVAPTVFSIPTSQREPKLVAVMMPFSAEFSPVYDAIRAACESVGLSCTRADEIWSESVIIQDVFELIYRSVVTVVDVTGLNGNVMYETGIAHTLGRPVVPISRSTGPLPFDLAHHRVLNYLPNQQGLDDLRTRLARKLATYVSD